MFLKLTGTGSWNRVIVINLDKIKYFTICNDGTRCYIDGDDEPVDVTEDLDFIMEYLQD